MKHKKTAVKKALHKTLQVTKTRGHDSLDLNEHLANQKHYYSKDVHIELIIGRFLTKSKLR